MADPAQAPLVFTDAVVEYQRKKQDPVRAVAGVSLHVERGQVHGLVGESGCGKSTLARAAVGLVPLSAGSIEFEGQPVVALGRKARPQRLRRLQMIFQDPHTSLNARRSVGDQISDALALSSTAVRNEYDQRVGVLLDQVGLPKRSGQRFPHEFSGGQRQRICIARALAAEPTALIADEPISALDASAQAQIAALLVDLARELSVALLFISHDLTTVRYVADVVTVMYLGTVAEHAGAAALWNEPLHPYSEALIGAVPRHDGSGVFPHALPGEVPDPASPPQGCRFNPRCAHAFGRCRSEEPSLIDCGPGRGAACWLQEAGAPMRASLKASLSGPDEDATTRGR